MGKFFESGRNRFLMVIMGIVAFFMLNLTVIHVSYKDTQYQNYLLQIAHQQHEQLTAYTNSFNTQPFAITQTQILNTDQSLKTFLEGGKLQATSPYVIEGIPEQAQGFLNDMWKQWRQIRKELLRHSNPQALRFSTEQELQLAALVQHSENFVQQMQQHQQQGEQAFSRTIWTLVLFDLLLMAGVFFLLRTVLFKPLEHMAESAEAIQEGDFKRTINIVRDDEIGKIGNALKQMTLHLNNASEFVDRIGEGQLDIEYNRISELDKHENGLTSALIEMQKKMQDVARQDEQRRWISEGLSRFVDLLRSNNDNVKDLADTIVRELVTYLKANQGQIYLLEERNHEQLLSLQACFAFDRKKFLERELKVGEGLIGQAVIERSTYHLTEIPEEYIKITSGLGEANPRALLIVPLKVNDEVMGALEIASFEKFEKYEVQFVERLAETVASTLKSVKVNEQTKMLLSDSREQAEQLRSAEEEMRQNMEELHATQEEMARKELEMSGQLAAINNTLATMELDMKGNIRQANEIFLNLSAYSDLEVRDKHIELFYRDDKQEKYKNLWNRIQLGQAITMESKFTAKDGQPIWFLTNFTPVKNQEDEFFKIIVLAIDITEDKKMSLEFDSQLEAINHSYAMIEFTADGIVQKANTNFLELMGYQADEIKGKHHRIFMPEEERASQEYQQFWKSLQTGETFKQDFKRVNSAGEAIWLAASYTPVRNDKGEVFKVVKLASDASERKKLELEVHQQMEQTLAQEEELRQNMEEMQATQEELSKRMKQNETLKLESDARMQALDESALLSESDIYGNIIYVNKKFCEVAKYTAEEVTGKPHNIIRHPDTPKEVFKELWETIKAGKVFKGSYPNRAKDGSTYWVDATIVPVMGDNGKPEKYIGIRFEITEEGAKKIMVKKSLEKAEK